jgi:hypothetical protein
MVTRENTIGKKTDGGGIDFGVSKIVQKEETLYIFNTRLLVC